MLRTTLLLLLFLCCSSRTILAQCLVPPAPPPSCTGLEPLLGDNETLSSGTTKWFYGSTTYMNSLTLDAGTLIVCGDLSIDKFYLESGTIIIRPGARLVITSGIGAGLIMKGNTAFYNYGTLEIQRNLSLDAGATAAKPNLVINATPSSVLKMGNQYMVINNPHSWFVNNGDAEFWGLITDNQSVAGAVCLGYSSVMRMSTLINKIKFSYNVPVGSACVYVRQFSQFFGALTSSPGLFACLGSGHSSDASCTAFGCTPNNWGAARIFSNCTSCGVIAVLPMQINSFTALAETAHSNLLSWQLNTGAGAGKFVIERSGDGIHYQAIDSLQLKDPTIISFTAIDKHPLKGNNFYMIRYTNAMNGLILQSKTIKLYSDNITGFSIYPVPFDIKFTISYPSSSIPEQIILTDIAGRNIDINYNFNHADASVLVQVLDKIHPDIYIVHIRTKKSFISRTIVKQ